MKALHARLSATHATSRKGGMTLVEVLIALFLVTLMCGGLYEVGLRARQSAEHNRLVTEARALAKERLEQMLAYGGENLAKPDCLLRNADTNYSSLGYDIVRQPSLVWHDADGSVVNASTASYVEVHVDVSYYSPLLKTQMTDSYPLLVEK